MTDYRIGSGCHSSLGKVKDMKDRSYIYQQKSSSHQSGFGLIESLVAIIVLAFGLLAVIGVQLEALRGNQQAAQSAIAASLVRDYQEMMVSLQSLQGANNTAANSITKNAYTAISSSPLDCKGTVVNCTTTQFADYQIKEWIDRVSKTLPGGVVTVCRDNAYKDTNGLYRWTCSNSGDIFVIKLGWNGKVSKSADGTILETGISDGTDRPRMVIPVTGNQAENN